MKKIIMIMGVFIAAIFLGFYVAVKICFIGGVIQILEVLNSPGPEGIDKMSFAIGAAKIYFSTIAGIISFCALIVSTISVFVVVFLKKK